MMSVLRRYPFSVVVFIAILYLSFFRPPEMKVDTGWISLDKLAHLCMYGGLSVVVWLERYRDLRRSHRLTRRPRRGDWCLGLAFPVVLGGLIEIAQGTLTTHRSGDVDDFVANAVGAVIASALAYVVWRRISRTAEDDVTTC